MTDDAKQRDDLIDEIAAAALKTAQARYHTGTQRNPIACPWCNDAQGGCRHCTQPDPLTVTGRLRWVGRALYLGDIVVGRVLPYVHGGWYGDFSAHLVDTPAYGTEAAARAALVDAVKEAIGG